MKQFLYVTSIAATIAWFLVNQAIGADKINIVATTPDLADLAKVVGGDEVEITALSRGDQDPHMIDPRPSMVMKVRKADLLLVVGMDLDMWARSLTDVAGNKNIVFGQKGYVDCSIGLKALQVPTEKFDGASGDIHVYGNPHYALDPKSAEFITRNILDGLIRVSPDKTAQFQKNREQYLVALNKKIAEWKDRLSQIKNKKIITYHDAWVYFAKSFGFDVVGNVEMKPGIPPSPAHLSNLLKVIREKKVAGILLSSFHATSPAEYLNKQTGIPLITIPQSTGGATGADTYIKFFDVLISQLISGLGEKGAGA